jgi:uncharacterized protein GlcG (DUF336 family)
VRGIPLVDGGKIIGAVGCSGGTGRAGTINKTQ